MATIPVSYTHLNISTAGYVKDSIYDELMLRSTSFLNGSSEETQLLPFLYMIDDIESVSYTHLDVYKRQLYMCQRVWNRV